MSGETTRCYFCHGAGVLDISDHVSWFGRRYVPADQLEEAVGRVADLERALLAAGSTLRKAGFTICADAADAARCPHTAEGA